MTSGWRQNSPGVRATMGSVRPNATLRGYAWPLGNVIVIMMILSQRVGNEDLETPAPPLPKCADLDPRECPSDCNNRGLCVSGNCTCQPSWTGPSCSIPRCPNNCTGHGVCLPDHTCLCDRRYAGPDCSTEVAELRIGETVEHLGVPYTVSGRLEEDLELTMNTRGAKKYARNLCRTQACSGSWDTQLGQILPFLPREDYRPHYKSCAVVSSGKQLVPNEEDEHSHDAHGADIDSHTMVLRLDNAPTIGYERWVGSKTTHRLVQGDYARLVHSMLGTEIVVNQTKSVVTPSTWWSDGYPSVEKVTYMMAVPGQYAKQQLRAPEHNGYAPFTEVFPGSKRFLLSPVFLKRSVEAHDRVREVVRSLGLACYKEQDKSDQVPPLFLAVIFALQVCNSVDVYGVTVGGDDHPGGSTKVYRDKKFRVRTRHGGHGGKNECCYFPRVEGYNPEVELCDELSRRHALRLLLETAPLRIFE